MRLSNKVFARLFLIKVSLKPLGRLARAADVGGRTPQSAKLPSLGVFFLIAFSFAPVYAKEKAERASDFFFWLLTGLKLLLLFLRYFSFIVLLCDQKYQKSHKVVPALCILPASSRFALCKQSSPSGANIASEPSNRNLSTATGSKRPRADSDLLLCYVRLWRTSRKLTDSRKRTRSASPRQGQKVAREA